MTKAPNSVSVFYYWAREDESAPIGKDWDGEQFRATEVTVTFYSASKDEPEMIEVAARGFETNPRGQAKRRTYTLSFGLSDEDKAVFTQAARDALAQAMKIGQDA
jgi:hypothetical protein